jgi:hypothetical protein
MENCDVTMTGSILISTLLCSFLICVTYISPFTCKLGLLLEFPSTKGLYLLRKEDHYQSIGRTLPSMTFVLCHLIENILQHKTSNYHLQESLWG